MTTHINNGDGDGSGLLSTLQPHNLELCGKVLHWCGKGSVRREGGQVPCHSRVAHINRTWTRGGRTNCTMLYSNQSE